MKIKMAFAEICCDGMNDKVNYGKVVAVFYHDEPTALLYYCISESEHIDIHYCPWCGESISVITEPFEEAQDE